MFDSSPDGREYPFFFTLQVAKLERCRKKIGRTAGIPVYFCLLFGSKKKELQILARMGEKRLFLLFFTFKFHWYDQNSFALRYAQPHR